MSDFLLNCTKLIGSEFQESTSRELTFTMPKKGKEILLNKTREVTEQEIDSCEQSYTFKEHSATVKKRNAPVPCVKRNYCIPGKHGFRCTEVR